MGLKVVMETFTGKRIDVSVGICVLAGCLLAGTAFAHTPMRPSMIENSRVPKGIARFTTDDWDFRLGNHRAVVEVSNATDVAVAYLPWRRRDAHPETRNILVVDAKSGKTVSNRVVLTCNREYGEIAFQPVSGSGRYYLYYLQPIYLHGPPWPVVDYVAPQETADGDWLARHQLAFEHRSTPGKITDWRALPAAVLVEFQSRCDESGAEWNSFYPMEVIATLDERLRIENLCRFRPFILFPENRKNPIRMTDDLPYGWAVRNLPELDQFSGEAMRNEYYVFQIGVYAFKEVLPHIKATGSDLKAADGATIPAAALTCFNLAGNDQCGRVFTKTVHVNRGQVQALWFGVDIPEAARPGVYEGTVTVAADDVAPQTVALRLTVGDQILADRGDGEGWRLSRLRWLNSRYGVDDEVCAPFTSLTVDGRRVGLLGRSVELAADGLPGQLASRIDMFRIQEEAKTILAAPVSVEAIRGGARVEFQSEEPRCVRQTPGVARFAAEARGGGMTRQVETTVEMDGYIGGRVTLKAETETALDTVRLTVPVAAATATFIMGNGASKAVTSRCPSEFHCGVEPFNATWLGDYNAGVALKLPGDRSSWINHRTGRVLMKRDGGVCRLTVESGPVALKAGEERSFTFELYVTPFKPLPDRHWDWRYYHAAFSTEPEVKQGLAKQARIFTIHQGCTLNPFISYPFPMAAKLRQVADEVHSRGGLLKAYYTIRELSNRAPELWMLRSLGNEILQPSPARVGYEELSQRPQEYQTGFYTKPSSGQAWMCEHLVNDYRSLWHNVINRNQGFMDGSLGISGASRWSNYYIEGLRWLMANAGLDGLYLDGVTFDHESFKRVRKALVRQKPEGLIDYHPWPNPFECLPILPYVDSLWYGEGADYSRDPDYWLVAISGIPFGTPGELLLPNASVQRGMVYGLCQRYGWMRGIDPGGLWKWWDEFDIKSARMIGYWQADCPVKIGESSVRATAYVHKGGKSAIALASWAKEAISVVPEIDYPALGLDPAKVELHAPAIPGFQADAMFHVGEAIPLMPNGGMIVEIHVK